MAGQSRQQVFISAFVSLIGIDATRTRVQRGARLRPQQTERIGRVRLEKRRPTVAVAEWEGRRLALWRGSRA